MRFLFLLILLIPSYGYAQITKPPLASTVPTDTTNFTTPLSTADNTVQKALETLNDAIGDTTIGTVTSVGDCVAGACLDGTSDGGTEIVLYQNGSDSKIYFTDKSAVNKAYFLYNGTTLSLYANGDLMQEWSSDTPAGLPTTTRLATRCMTITDVKSTDDDYPFGSFYNDAIIKNVWCTCYGTCTTKAEFSLENMAGTPMTITGTNPTCGDSVTIPTPAAITANNSLSAFESLKFNVDNTPNPTTDTYELCVSYSN